MDFLKSGECTFHWLNGGCIQLDGGAMFGVVPKALWAKKCKPNEWNQIAIRTDPIYFNIHNKHILIDAGLGFGKLTDKQKRNYGVIEESNIEQSLSELGVTPEEINIICMTHLHFDHASGLTKKVDGHFESMFPNAKIYVSHIEWDEMKNPNIRSKNTYWKENWQPIEQQVITFVDEIEIEKQIKMIHTGGHSNGHAMITIDTAEERLIHMGDLLPTIAHKPNLWVTAYDDYPMDSIKAKEQWIQKEIENASLFIFYHDFQYRAIKWDERGEIIKELKR